MKKMVSTVIIISMVFLVSCGYSTTPPSYIQPYLNKTMAFPTDMYIEEFKSWVPGSHTITFVRYADKDSMAKAGIDLKSRQWKTIWLGQWTRVMGTVKKGTLFKIYEYREPSLKRINPKDPYAIIVVLNGPSKGIKGEAGLNDMGLGHLFQEMPQ